MALILMALILMALILMALFLGLVHGGFGGFLLPDGGDDEIFIDRPYLRD